MNMNIREDGDEIFFNFHELKVSSPFFPFFEIPRYFLRKYFTSGR